MRRRRSDSDLLAGLIAATAAACEGAPVGVGRVDTLIVHAETSGTVSVGDVERAVGPGASAEVPLGSEIGPLVFERGDDTLTLLDVRGPEVRLDPFLRAAGFGAETHAIWRLDAAPASGATPAAALVAGGRARLARGGQPFELEGPAGPATWVVLWSSGGRATRWTVLPQARAGEDTAAIPRGGLTGTLDVSIESPRELWVEVLPVVEGVPVPLPLASGLAGGGRGLTAPVPDDEAVFGLAVRIVDGAAGRGGPDRDVILPLAGGVRSVHLTLPEAAPMAPEPSPDLARAVPLGSSDEAVAWTPPAGSVFWGLGLSDPEGCVPGKHWVFARPDRPALPLPMPLRGAAVLDGRIAGWQALSDYEALTAADEAPPESSDWPFAVGRAGLVRPPIEGCEAEPADEGLFVVLPAEADPCDEAAVLGLARADACGRLAFESDDPAVRPFRCGTWRDGAFVDAAGRAFQARSEPGPEGRAAWRLDHPLGSLRLVEARAVRGTATLPPEWPRSARRVTVTAHLERPERPGEAILGTEETSFSGEPSLGPWLSLTSDGGLTAAWPGTRLDGLLTADGEIRRRHAACDEVETAATLQGPATSGGAFVLRLRSLGPMRDGRPTVRLQTARLER